MLSRSLTIRLYKIELLLYFVYQEYNVSKFICCIPFSSLYLIIAERNVSISFFLNKFVFLNQFYDVDYFRTFCFR
jgi:hypothetical protein